MTEDPLDPFSGDPTDPAADLGDAIGPDDGHESLSPEDREDVLADLADLEVYQTLLEPQDVRGLVVDCEDCGTSHYFGWALLRGNLRQLLDAGQTTVHEPAYDPDPSHYVTWEYARGYADGVQDTESQRDT
ncbi:MAG: DUF5319 domain-containing protein [Pseudonocardiales bacterium]